MVNSKNCPNEYIDKNKTSITVVGSINLDIVATSHHLPEPGETLTGAEINQYPGGKGANQALAAHRLGANVSLICSTGCDAAATKAMELLIKDKVDLSRCQQKEGVSTGVALIIVAKSGLNQIVVAPGANMLLEPSNIDLPASDATICQLEIPMETVLAAAEASKSFFCLNAAPASHQLPKKLLDKVDLLVVNEVEAKSMEADICNYEGLLAISYGSEGAILKSQGKEIARAKPPQVDAIDTTGCGDAFTAALTLYLVSGDSPQVALNKACLVGALTATKPGAQPSFPFWKEVQTHLN